MKALLVGLGGIGKNVYLPQLQNLGYTVSTLDINGLADYSDINDIKEKFDVGVICTPNFTHQHYAYSIANFCKTIFIEKPGLPSAYDWESMCNLYPDNHFIMCKNNLYRDDYGALTDLMNKSITPTRIEVTWLNSDRVPSPGSWFTNKKTAWGGVALDLFPHLYCHLSKIVPLSKITRTQSTKCQQWNLNDLATTNYGSVDSNGVYDVSDYAEETWLLDNIPISVKAGWKTGIDDQSVRVYTSDSTYEWRFGLCPDDAYGRMIHEAPKQQYKDHMEMDIWIHKQLEVYREV